MSAIVVNKKSNGKIRLCLDPQPLNKALKRCHYPIPTIEDVLPDLANEKVFTKLDCKNGYWQVKLDKDSSTLTTFNTPFGRYKWTRMPFGISPAGEIFQRRLDQAIDRVTAKKMVSRFEIFISRSPSFARDLEQNSSQSFSTPWMRGYQALRLQDGGCSTRKENTINKCSKVVFFQLLYSLEWCRYSR